MKKSDPATSDLLDSLPEPTADDTAALRLARQLALDGKRANRLQRAMKRPSHEDLARRSITDGEPFRL